MDANELLDLSLAACVVSTEGKLANRLDSALDSVRSGSATSRRLVGLQVACANTGILIGRLGQRPVITLDMGLANGLDQVIPLDIAIPVGQELTFHALSSAGTAICSAVAHIATGG